MRLSVPLLIRRRFIIREEPKVNPTKLPDPIYTKFPVYPSILDVSEHACEKREKEKWHNKIKTIGTIEEKLFELNMPKYWGWECVNLSEFNIVYNCLKFFQKITRTHFIETDDKIKKLSDGIELSDIQLKRNSIRSQIEDGILFEHELRRNNLTYHPEAVKLNSGDKENIIGNFVVEQINRIIIANLAKEYPHIMKVQVDHAPRIEAFWFLGGVDVPLKLQNERKKDPKMKERVDDPFDRNIQYVGSPILQLRSELPLEPIMSLPESENPDFLIPSWPYDPKIFGYENERKHVTSIPGFWPGDVCEFGLLSFHSRGHLTDHKVIKKEEDINEALHSQAILSSFGWLSTQAYYQGFSTFNDITYPLVTQTVISNGQLWSFYKYQLNTTLLHSENADNNDRRNICWGSAPQKLYEGIENGKVIGFNDDVLDQLLQMYTNIPKPRTGIVMKPYLDPVAPRIAAIKEDERRIWLENHYKHLVSNRPRKLLPYEIYDWERIYKIDHETRPIEPRRRPFELGFNPLEDRRLDDHSGKYIPKILRKEEEKRIKFYKTYYPKGKEENPN